MAGTDTPQSVSNLGFGLERLGFLALAAPWLSTVVLAVVTAFALAGLGRIQVDDSLSELFRTNTPEFAKYEEIDRRFPSSEYDVLAVVEGKGLLTRQGLAAFAKAAIELQLADGVSGLVSMVSARGKPDATGYAAPIVPDDLPDDETEFARMVDTLRKNEIVAGKFLSDDGTLALMVMSLDRETVQGQGAKSVIEGIREAAEQAFEPAGLSVKLTGAPVMQLEIRNAVERDRLVYNGLGFLLGAVIAMIFFRRLSFMIMAVVPPILAVVWSLGALGWLGFKLNLFLNVMTPLVMVMGFADSMQVTSAIRDRLRQGDSRDEALRFGVRVVGPACVIAHGTALLSFLALTFSPSGLIRTFGLAGVLSVIVSYLVVIAALPVLGRLLIRGDESAGNTAAVDGAMDALGRFVGVVVDRVVRNPVFFSLLGFASFAVLGLIYQDLQPRYRLADQVPDREQALSATARLDQKLTGGNPAHIMIEWKDGRSIYDPTVMAAIGRAHDALEKQAGVGNVWSLDSLRRWLAEAGDTRIETVKKFVEVLPETLVRRFIAKEQDAVLVTGRLPDVDSSQILPVVEKLDRVLDGVRKDFPGLEISVTGLPAIAARSSARMIGQLKTSLFAEVTFVSILLGLAFRSVGVMVLSLLPGLFPVVTSGALLRLTDGGLEFASVVALVVIFGLGIDSLIHFLNRLRREERPGEDPALAIRRARVLVGPAIILTTIVLVLGLGVTVFSDLPSLRLFGRVCAVTLAASLIGDLVFLPATIMLWQRWQRR
jgi:predicted RND superfamily exporter protein